MTPAARLSAAIEVFADIDARRRPAADALKDWGLAHRFAGSGDRAAIAGLVYDALRRKSSSAWLMAEASPRAVLIGMLHRERGLDAAAIAALFDGSRYAPAPLRKRRRRRLAVASPTPRPISRAIIRNGSIRIWRGSSVTNALAEGAALASRAPLDLRVNTLLGSREDALPKLAHLGAEPTRWSPVGLTHPSRGGCQKPGDPRRTAISERPYRNPG